MENKETQEEHDKKSRIRLLTYNIFIRPPFVTTNGNDHKSYRLSVFSNIHLKDYDIINFQEIFRTLSNKQSKLITSSKTKGLTHSAISPKPKLFSKFMVGSGLLTVSRFKILKQDFKHFEYFAGVDRLAQKGVLYSKIQLSDERVMHLFNLHTQASYTQFFEEKSREEYTARMNQIVVVRNMVEHFVKKNSNLSYGAHLFKDLIILAGDFNVNSHEGSIPSSLFEDLHDKRALDWLESVEEGERTQYNFMTHVLGGYGEDKVIDFLKQGSEDGHPVTYGDCTNETIFDEKGNAVDMVFHPKEIIMTKKSHFNSQMCLDYIFQILPEGVEKAKINGECKVEEFFVQGGPVTQLSDHYGVVLDFDLESIGKVEHKEE